MNKHTLQALFGGVLGGGVGVALTVGTGNLGVGIGVGVGLAILFGGGTALLNKMRNPG